MLIIDGAEDGEQINLTSQLKMIEWKTYTCTYGWPVQGIWPKKANIGKDPEPTSAHRSTSETLLITGYTNGDIKLYNYPVLSKDVSTLSIYFLPFNSGKYFKVVAN